MESFCPFKKALGRMRGRFFRSCGDSRYLQLALLTPVLFSSHLTTAWTKLRRLLTKSSHLDFSRHLCKIVPEQRLGDKSPMTRRVTCKQPE